jgi:hypothetical protein
MEILTIIKVKPKPNGYWFQNSKWDILRAMRESEDYIVAAKDEKGTNLLLEKKDIVGKTISVKGDTFVVRPDNVITRIHLDLTT